MRALYRLTDSETPLGNAVLFVMMLGVLVLFGFAAGCDVAPEGVQGFGNGHVREMAPPQSDGTLDAGLAASTDTRAPEADTRMTAPTDMQPTKPDVQHDDVGHECKPGEDSCGPSACITPRDGTTPYVVSHACVEGRCVERRFLCAGVACVGRGGYSRVSGCLQPYGAACQPIDMPAVLCQQGFECKDGGRMCTPQ